MEVETNPSIVKVNIGEKKYKSRLKTSYLEKSSLFEMLLLGTSLFTSAGIGLHCSNNFAVDQEWSVAGGLLSGVGVAIFLYLLRRRCKNKVHQIGLIGGVTCCLLLIALYFGGDYYHALMIAQCAIGLAALLWRYKEKFSHGINYVMVLISLALFSLYSWHLCQCVHLYFIECNMMQIAWGGIWDWAIWSSSPSIINTLENSPLLNFGVTFLSGCLLIIAWSKDKPCEHWNPFSAQKLALSNRMPFISLGLWIMLCYAFTGKFYIWAFLSCMLLLYASITTAFFCYHLQNDRAIRHCVIEHINWIQIQSWTKKEQFSFDINCEPLKKESYRKLINMTLNLQEIARSTVLNMKKQHSKNQTNYMIQLVHYMEKGMIKETPENTLGFLVGLGAIPTELDEEVTIQNFLLYYYWMFKNFKEYLDNNRSLFYEYFCYGIIVGGAALSYEMQIRNERISGSKDLSESALKIMFWIDDVVDIYLKDNKNIFWKTTLLQLNLSFDEQYGDVKEWIETLAGWDKMNEEAKKEMSREVEKYKALGCAYKELYIAV